MFYNWKQAGWGGGREGQRQKHTNRDCIATTIITTIEILLVLIVAVALVPIILIYKKR